MEVLILSKTKYGTTKYCIGGIVIDTHQFIRLLEPGGYYQPLNTRFEVGDIWDINFRKASATREPHNEDVTVIDKTFVKKVYKLKSYISNIGVRIWKGNISNAFDGTLRWTGSGSGYLSENQASLPSHSVGFWIPENDLHYKNGYYHIDGKKINYKGTDIPKQIILKGSLIRLSLAKWWCPEDFYESRCYLQLSGWYEDKPEPAPKPVPAMAAATAAASTIGKTHTQTSQTRTSSSYPSTPYKTSFSGSGGYSSSSSRSNNTSGGCYIATVCYNDYYAEEVCDFRDFRDHTLSKSKLGRSFIIYYYRKAPAISVFLSKRPFLNKLIRNLILNPMLKNIKHFGLNESN